MSVIFHLFHFLPNLPRRKCVFHFLPPVRKKLNPEFKEQRCDLTVYNGTSKVNKGYDSRYDVCGRGGGMR